MISVKSYGLSSFNMRQDLLRGGGRERKEHVRLDARYCGSRCSCVRRSSAVGVGAGAAV